MATMASEYPVAQNAGELVRRTTLGVLVAVVASLAVLAVVDALGLVVGAGGARSPFAAGPVVFSTVVAGASAAVVYAALVRLTDQPDRFFLAVAAVVFAGMLVPVAVIAPGLGVTAVGQAVLAVLHVAVAVPLVAFVVGAVRL